MALAANNRTHALGVREAPRRGATRIGAVQEIPHPFGVPVVPARSDPPGNEAEMSALCLLKSLRERHPRQLRMEWAKWRRHLCVACWLVLAISPAAASAQGTPSGPSSADE